MSKNEKFHDVDQGDFSALVKKHQGIIRAFLTRLCADASLADDLAQDTFLQAHKQFSDLRNPKAAKAWLFRIAYNLYVGHVRKSARRRDLSVGSYIAAEEPLEAPRELKLDIEQAMGQLPPDMRAALMLCLSYGMSHSEAAIALSVPLGTVKSHVARGRKKLMTLLSDYQRV